jgi:glycosyltransferase involved in cell wall biosynthesis
VTVILTIASLDARHGGPSQSVPALAEALAGAGSVVKLVTCEPESSDASSRLPDLRLVSTQFLPLANSSSNWRARRNAFFAATSRPGAVKPCVIHDNGLWLPNNHAVAVAARTLGQPLIVSPRGMLSAWALRFKALKKRLAWWLYQQKDLRSAKVLHATSKSEAEEFRLAAGMIQPIAVIPNGVEFPESQRPPTGGAGAGSRTVLFLGRIHPVKGLMDLIAAWSRLNPAGWRVVIAGTDEGGHREALKAESRRLRLNDCFQFVGPVYGAAKWELYRSADVFVLPSSSENFGIAVAEALACGVPVVTTRGTPWEELVSKRCGWWTEIGSEPLAAALREAMALSDAARHEMGNRGAEWVRSKFSWTAAAAEMKKVYDWMVGASERPDCVVGR